LADFVIVGAGSAGCVLANRLSEDPSAQVVVLEAGGRDSDLLYRIPAGFFPLMKAGKGNWNFETTPQPGLAGRTMYFPRGRVLGGSSSINGLVVSRGNPADYDRWAQMGAAGWSFADLLPYFKKIENYPDGDPALRGRGGPVGVTRMPIEKMHPISRAWIEASRQRGDPFNEDPNGLTPLGVAQMQGNWANGVRQSAASAYLRPALGRANLKVATGARATRILFEGARAVGVEYAHGGRRKIVRADREVVLCGGVVNSPQLLQLSGVGDPADLAPHGVKVVQALPGVGKNLRDHLSITLKQRLTVPISLLKALQPMAMVGALGEYLLFKSGPTSFSGLEAWSHLNSRPDLEYPDIQVYCVHLMYNDHGRDVIPVEGFMAALSGSRPNSVGSIRIGAADPLAAPIIDPRYLSDPEDLRVLREGLRQAREIIAQPAFDRIRGEEYAPGEPALTDDQLDAYIRENAATLYHPVGTCKMGVGADAVVDPALKVKGVDGLRVADASIMPHITSGNTNFPSMMIGEKAADLILADA
jgi:choline dehydrogenase